MKPGIELDKSEMIRKKLDINSFNHMNNILKKYDINTVCNESLCPNRGECFNNKTATFLILGNKCTRNCKFCNISKGSSIVDLNEPEKIANISDELGLSHVVITSVTRDDLKDYGAEQFVKTIKLLKNKNKTVEVLIPDFMANKELLFNIVKEKPDIISHNIEVVHRLSKEITNPLKYNLSTNSLKILRELINSIDYPILLKSGFMVGLGETDDEVFHLINVLNNIGCDIITIGQYLRPSINNYPVKRFVTVKKFSNYKTFAKSVGVKHIESGPYIRSSYHSNNILYKFKK